MRRTQYLTLLPFLTLFGCIESRLADSRFTVTQKFHGASEAFVVAGRTFNLLANEMASKKHALQQEVSDKVWKNYLARHTDKKGRLVSIDADGKMVPLSLKDLNANLVIREEHLSRLAKSKGIWGKSSFDWGAALDSFNIANVETLVTQTEIRKAEKEADELARRALTVLGTIAAGAAMTGL